MGVCSSARNWHLYMGMRVPVLQVVGAFQQLLLVGRSAALLREHDSVLLMLRYHIKALATAMPDEGGPGSSGGWGGGGGVAYLKANLIVQL